MKSNSISALLSHVHDPEIPVLNILDMGIVRKIELKEDLLVITITPTYSGCPAMDMIAVDIKAILMENGYEKVEVKTVLSPAWSTDWISEEGLQKMKDYGIAPPIKGEVDKSTLFPAPKIIPCPRCESDDTKLLSQFGSTACKALYQCNSCKEPFDYFKCH